MASDIEELADALAQVAEALRSAQDWRDVGDMLSRFEQRARVAHEEAAAAIAERDRLREELEALRVRLRTEPWWTVSDDAAAIADEIDAIVSGGES